jgi:hypothetical protein
MSLGCFAIIDLVQDKDHIFDLCMDSLNIYVCCHRKMSYAPNINSCRIHLIYLVASSYSGNMSSINE